MTTRALEAGADLLQDKTPLQALDTYMDGFHFYNGDFNGQMEAHHYCGHLSEKVIQCVIFDGNGKDAKIIGVEYVLSRELFEALPTEEKHLWHSHAYEVRSGQLIAPRIPRVAEHELMKKLATTYGKTWHTWHTDRHEEIPSGAPTLMMGFTRDGQIDEQMVAERDERFGVSSTAIRQNRADIDYPPIDPDADAWQKGVIMQAEIRREDAR
ncbi:MAG: OBAP family protein [Gammaproteobacteria bacterium]